MYRHFLQSEAWESFEKSLGAETFREKSEDFEFFAIKKATKLGSYLFVPYGPALKTSKSDSTLAEKSLETALESLKALAKRERCFFIRLEPTVALNPEFLRQKGFIKTHDHDPARTWLLDLTPDKETLLHNFSQGTRTRHNQFTKKHLELEVSHNPENIKHLVRLQRALAKEKGITAYDESYLKAELAQPFASLYLVHFKDPETNKDQIIAASLFFDDQENSTRYYMQSAAASEYKKLPATVGLLTSSLFDAKEKGLKYLDFWGIAPDDAEKTHPWAGFTRFKQSFGGFAKDCSGTWDYVLNKPKYTLYKGLREINKKIKRL
ncbi:peptidoglycan bridge formation glycyltransferase FemA/FemB family protein [Candidatus Saccharibacteria bacterium]|nr:peptidoglycan bridge formation glycyltransferase FemA/FemB family protein [Candidatus Saccharibacteria bacterium]